jgi:hypothetical protein
VMPNDLPISFIEAILSGISVFFLLTFFRSIYDSFINRKPVRYFWDECLRSPVSIVVPAYSDDKSLHTNRMVSLASTKIESLLRSFHRKPDEIKTFEAIDLEDMGENVVLIGGPTSNEITRKVMNLFEIPFCFEDHVLNCRNEKYEPRLDENGEIAEDYAFIFRTRNPYDKRKILLIIAGCHVYGCFSGAIAVTDSEILKVLYKEARKKSMGVIIRTHVIHETAQRPFLLELFGTEDEINIKA